MCSTLQGEQTQCSRALKSFPFLKRNFQRFSRSDVGNIQSAQTVSAALSAVLHSHQSYHSQKISSQIRKSLANAGDLAKTDEVGLNPCVH